MAAQRGLGPTPRWSPTDRPTRECLPLSPYEAVAVVAERAADLESSTGQPPAVVLGSHRTPESIAREEWRAHALDAFTTVARPLPDGTTSSWRLDDLRRLGEGARPWEYGSDSDDEAEDEVEAGGERPARPPRIRDAATARGVVGGWSALFAPQHNPFVGGGSGGDEDAKWALAADASRSPRHAPPSPRYSSTAGGPDSPRYAPNSPVYAPSSPVYAPGSQISTDGHGSPNYGPSSPVYAPSSSGRPIATDGHGSPNYGQSSPARPMETDGHGSPNYGPSSPVYAPSSPVAPPPMHGGPFGPPPHHGGPPSFQMPPAASASVPNEAFRPDVAQLEVSGVASGAASPHPASPVYE